MPDDSRCLGTRAHSQAPEFLLPRLMDQPIPEAPLVHVAYAPMTAIGTLRANAIQLAHALPQGRIARIHHQQTRYEAVGPCLMPTPRYGQMAHS